jgi:hypothetical protein
VTLTTGGCCNLHRAKPNSYHRSECDAHPKGCRTEAATFTSSPTSQGIHKAALHSVIEGRQDVSTLAQKKAIVLHGPPGVGKSQVCERILRHLGTAAVRISLDRNWGPGESRFEGGKSRYADLASAQADTIVLELGWGEPSCLEMPGAVQGAQEWVDVLTAAGRQLFPFLLWADFTNAVSR